MTKIRVTKEFDFEMAHALNHYDGPCKNIHGHSYIMSVTILGKPVQDKNNPKYGMVVDFGDLKKWIKNSVINELDHALILSSDTLNESLLKSPELFSKLKIVDFQPTCENLLVFIVTKIKEILPSELDLYSVKLKETSNSYAEWYADDNN